MQNENYHFYFSFCFYVYFQLHLSHLSSQGKTYSKKQSVNQQSVSQSVVSSQSPHVDNLITNNQQCFSFYSLFFFLFNFTFLLGSSLSCNYGSSDAVVSMPCTSDGVCVSYCYQSKPHYTCTSSETASAVVDPKNARYYGNGPYKCTTNNCNSGNKACTNINLGTPPAVGLGVGLGIGLPLIGGLIYYYCVYKKSLSVAPVV